MLGPQYQHNILQLMVTMMIMIIMKYVFDLRISLLKNVMHFIMSKIV